MGQTFCGERTQVEPISRIDRPLATELSNTQGFAKHIQAGTKITRVQIHAIETQLYVVNVLLDRKDYATARLELDEARTRLQKIGEALKNIEVAAGLMVDGTARMVARTVVE